MNRSQQLDIGSYARRCGNGSLVINADDWGRDRNTTDSSLNCFLAGALSSVSSMVFMEDSERSAKIALEHNIDAGLHLNFTLPFSLEQIPARLEEHQKRLSKYLLRHRLAQTFFHPGLVTSFEYVAASQIDEFERLYGTQVCRIDGHHHMHLCMNVVLGGLLPTGILVRRSFSFQKREKSILNRLYRNALDNFLRRRYRTLDYLFSLSPVEPRSRLRRIFELARDFAVELEVHSVNPSEYRFLAEGEILKCAEHIRIASRYERPDSHRGLSNNAFQFS